MAIFFISYALVFSQSTNETNTNTNDINTNIDNTAITNGSNKNISILENTNDIPTGDEFINAIIAEESNEIHHFYYLSDDKKTNTITYTNTIKIEKEKPLKAWQKPITNLRIFILTNIVTNTLTNVVFGETLITNEYTTNIQEIKTNVVFIFYDPFPELIDIRFLESADDLRFAIADMLFPGGQIVIENPHKPKWKKRREYKTIHISDKAIDPFSDKYFDEYLLRKKHKRLKFTKEELEHLHIGFEQWDTKVIIKGWINLRMGYGWSKKDENFPQAISGITPGFNMDQVMKINVIGKFGDRFTVDIKQDSDNPENYYEIAYKALKTDTGILREARAGNVALNIPDSSTYIKYSGTSKESYGALVKLQKGNFSLQTVISMTRSKKGYKKFTGKSRLVNREIADVSYIKRKYFVLPDKNIDSGTLELLQLTTATNLADRQIDSLYFDRLVEGQDYYINYQKGELNLIKSSSRDVDLVICYTSGGSLFTTNSNSSVGTDNNTGDLFLYLWKTDKNYSQYIHYGYYNIGHRDFDPTRGFSLTVVETADKSKLANFQFVPANYEINPITGIIKFTNMKPFPDSSGEIYSNASDPSSAYSEYTMKFTLYDDISSYRLDFGVIPNTEKVFVNGRQLSRNEYTMIHVLGELIFNNSSMINENDVIEVYYEYKPFFLGSQKFGLATRFDWKPSKMLNLGSTVIYNVSQRPPGGAPQINSTPTGLFMADIDGSINISKIVGLDDNYQFTIKSEYAVSSLDANTAGYAMIDDFENAGQTYKLSANENRWQLCAPTTNIADINYSNRGKLLYRDYRKYALDNSYSLLDFSTVLETERIHDYTNKPGPYLTLGGHLDPVKYPQINQSSLIFDYDFTDGNWIGASINIAGPSGNNFSEYNQIIMWVKLQSDDDNNNEYEDSGSQAVNIIISAGQPNEDSDGDGVFDAEIDRSQTGYPFNNYTTPSQIDTYIGKGRLGEGDGYIQSEDMNRNSVMDTNENLVIFPSPQGYTDITNAIVYQGGWQKITINISSLGASQVDILEHVSALGIYIKKNNGNRGRVIFDSIEFKKINWKDKRIDGINANYSTLVIGEALSVYNNTYYSKNRFYTLGSADSNVVARAEIFEKLHGPRTVAEAEQFNEMAMAIHYNLSNIVINTNFIPPVGGKSGTLMKKNSYAFDISRYKYLSFYFYVPSKDEAGNDIKSGGDTFNNESFMFILGNSDNSYYKWSIPLNSISHDSWHKATIDLANGLVIDVDGVEMGSLSSSGYPNTKDINYIELGVETTSDTEPINKGIVWVNEMYVSSDTPTVGTAFYVSPSIIFKKPLWTVNNFEIFGPLTVSGKYEKKELNFISSESASALGNMNQNYNISLKSRMFKYLSYTVSYNWKEDKSDTNENEVPDYLQWNSGNNSFNLILGFNRRKNYIPTFSHTYTESFNNQYSRSLVSSTNSDYVLGISDLQYNSSLQLKTDDKLPIGKNFTIIPNFSAGDAFYIIDKSNFTNDDNKKYLTNSSVYGMKNLKKNVGTGIRFHFWQNKLSISGGYNKSEERYSKIYDINGYRDEINAVRETSLAKRYGERFASISQGFYFAEENYEKALSESISATLSSIKPVKYFSFTAKDNYSRSQSGFAYDTDRNLTSRSESYKFSNKWELNIYPHFANINKIIDRFSFKVTRDSGLSYNSPTITIESSNAIEMGEVYYMQPFYYNAFILEDEGRSNALAYVEKFADDSYNSSTTLSDKFTFDLTLPRYDGFIGNMIPKSYRFASTLSSARNLSSYSQSLQNSFSFTVPLKLTELFQKVTNVKIGDINNRFAFGNIVNYNDRKISDTFTWSLSHSLFASKTLNFQINYSLKQTSESYLTNTENFEKYFGLTATPPNASPRIIYDHSASITANWIIKNLKEIKFWIIYINLRGSTLNNKDTLRFSSQIIDYTGTLFTRYNQRLFEISFEHSTSYKFSEIVTGKLTAKFIVNQYAEITPLGNSLEDDTVNTTYFDPGFGFQIALDMRIKI